MRIILDTNVFVSGVFFKGPPYQILDAWRHGNLDLALSLEILEEYHRVGGELQIEFPDIDLTPFLELLIVRAEVHDAPPLPDVVCRDADDDMFLACALAADIKIIVSGDKYLLAVSGYEGLEILTPRAFVNRYLS